MMGKTRSALQLNELHNVDDERDRIPKELFGPATSGNKTTVCGSFWKREGEVPLLPRSVLRLNPFMLAGGIGDTMNGLVEMVQTEPVKLAERDFVC